MPLPATAPHSESPHQTRVLPVLECHLCGVVQCELFVAWLPVCGTMSPCVSHLCRPGSPLGLGGLGFVPNPCWGVSGLFSRWEVTTRSRGVITQNRTVGLPGGGSCRWDARSARALG